MHYHDKEVSLFPNETKGKLKGTVQECLCRNVYILTTSMELVSSQTVKKLLFVFFQVLEFLDQDYTPTKCPCGDCITSSAPAATTSSYSKSMVLGR